MRQIALVLALLLAPSTARADFGLRLKYTATVGAWTQGVLAQDATDANMLRFTPSDAGTTPWYQWAGSFANTSGSRRNQVMRMGWNCGPGGGRQNTGVLDGALCWEQEQFYVTAGGNKVMEWHLSSIAPNDALTRVFSGSADTEAPYPTALYGYSTQFVLGSGHTANDPPSLQIYPLSTTIKSPSAYRKLLLNDDPGDTSVHLTNGEGGDAAKADIQLQANGGVSVTSKFILHLTNGVNDGFNLDTTSAQLLDPSASPQSRVVADANGVYVYTGGLGGYSMLFQAAATSMVKPIRANGDKSPTESVGLPAHRPGYGAFAMSAADWAAQTCDVDNEGMSTTVVYGVNLPSCHEECQKTSTNTYAKVQIKCAP